MDDRRFDELTKALVAAKPSRREALRRLAGGALATVIGGLALEEATAQDVGTEARTCGQFCNKNRPCNAGLHCGAASEQCFALPSSKDRCAGNGDCNRNYETCSSRNRCINTLAGGCRECRRDGDCLEANARCRDGRCRTPECNNDNDCRRRERCNGKGRCVDRN